MALLQGVYTTLHSLMSTVNYYISLSTCTVLVFSCFLFLVHVVYCIVQDQCGTEPRVPASVVHLDPTAAEKGSAALSQMFWFWGDTKAATVKATTFCRLISFVFTDYSQFSFEFPSDYKRRHACIIQLNLCRLQLWSLQYALVLTLWQNRSVSILSS